MNSKIQQGSDLPQLAAPARRALAAAGIDRLEQLAKFGETEIAQLHGIGPSALKQLRRALSANGLSFAAENPAGESRHMKPANSKDGPTPSQLITNQIAELDDWRGSRLARLRKLILEADPGITEEWKWGTAVWSHAGNVVAIGVFKDHVKVNFFQGASLIDSHRLFNAGLEAKATRAIDLHEGDKINAPAMKDLIRAAVAHNLSGRKKK